MPKFGFYDYDTAVVGSDGVIYKESLTSLPSAGASELGAGTHTYSSAGFTGEPTAGLSFNGISGQANLAVEGTIRFMVSKDVFDSDTLPAAAQNFITLIGGTRFDMNKNNVSGYFRTICSGVMDGKSPGTIDQWGFGTTEGWETNSYDQVECILTWDQCGLKVFIDKLKHFDVLWVSASTKPDFSTIDLNSAGSGGGTYTWRDLLISTKKTVIKPSSHKTRLIHFYGDSYVQQGNYPQVTGSGQQRMYYFSSSDEALAPSTTEDGLSGTQWDNDNGTILDAGMIPQLHRRLNKAGITTNKISMWGEGGTGYETSGAGSGDTVPQRIDIALNGNYGIPQIAVLAAGYNDSDGTGVADTGTYQTAIEGCISAIKAVNANCIIIMCTIPFKTGTFSPSLANVQEVNSVITTVANADADVTLIDIYSLFGGATNDGSVNFHTDNIHPSAAGHAVYGNAIADAILKRL